MIRREWKQVFVGIQSVGSIVLEKKTSSICKFANRLVGHAQDVFHKTQNTPKPDIPNVEWSQFDTKHKKYKEKNVPSTPMSRLYGFSSLAAKLAMGTASNAVMNIGNKAAGSVLVSAANNERLVEALCTMRGAALKLGQMLSIQDEDIVPSSLSLALEKVRQNAHIMPKKQLQQVLVGELGMDWENRLEKFDYTPIAAASIGQVHRGKLADGTLVALKVQYPGVAESIKSDLSNLKRLLSYTNVLPKGLYIDEIMRVGQEELVRECNYILEAENQLKFKQLIEKDRYTKSRFIVPSLHTELCTRRVLVSDLVAGVAVDKIIHASQEIRNKVARRILVLTIKELFEWRFMQTDPNWSNFMYHEASDRISLVDFGAALAYDKPFVDEYIRVVWAAANGDAATMMESSIKLKFITGQESSKMIAAHEAAGMVVGEPFRSHEPFDFAKSKLTKRLAELSSIFMQDRLTPPPQQAYSLHRKLGGAFLMCIKLKAVIPCRDVLEQVYNKYDF